MDVTADLRRAVVYYTVFGEETERRATRAGLRSASAHLRGALGRQVRLKFLPELEFREDEHVAEAERLEKLLREIHEVEEPRDAPA